MLFVGNEHACIPFLYLHRLCDLLYVFDSFGHDGKTSTVALQRVIYTTSSDPKMASSISRLPELPVTCLRTAKELKTTDIVKGSKTVIGKCDRTQKREYDEMIFLLSSSCTLVCFQPDFWTTRCTRCPDALDKLDDLAAAPRFANVQFVSICCDKLDGAREIIEKETEPRWQNVDHYFMEHQYKEEAKNVLGFSAVPFYVMLNEKGETIQMGNAIDFERLAVEEAEPDSVATENEKENMLTIENPVVDLHVGKNELRAIKLDDFSVDDLDF